MQAVTPIGKLWLVLPAAQTCITRTPNPYVPIAHTHLLMQSGVH